MESRITAIMGGKSVGGEIEQKGKRTHGHGQQSSGCGEKGVQGG